MTFEINKIYQGFKLVDKRKLEEIKSTALIFSHEKTQAQLVYLSNQDDNKVFSIGFRTPPENSTGVPHIIEHCVLSGSRKYTTKEPFMDMVKSSLQTFINAMTFYDKTIYPVASRNKKDFYNLMDVYLDAVFFPKIYEKESIFMQEGWHHEIFHKDEEISYKGVVYNEMKGAYSQPESLLNDFGCRSLYPDNCYRYSSGGNPLEIPDLSYDEFLDFHRKFYHPSNSYIYLYGDGDILEDLAYINDNYLSKFEKKNIDSRIEEQKAFEKRNYEEYYYNLPEDQDPSKKTFLNMNFVLGKNSDPVDNIMSTVLSDILISSGSAPLKTALMDHNIAEDIFPMSCNGIQTSFGLVAKNASYEDRYKFEEIIIDSLKELCQKGIDKDLLRASLSIAEYDLREASGSSIKGLIYLYIIFESWLYDEDPLLHLEYNETLDFLKSKIETDYFERYIEEKIIKNPHSSLVVVRGKKGLDKEEQEESRKKLADFKASLKEDELEELIEKNIRLRDYQLAPDKEEDKATIPRLSKEDINTDVIEINQEVFEEDGYKILYHDIFTSGISYIDFLFDSTMVEEEDLAYVNILTRLLGDLDTENFSYSDLDNQIYIKTGGINLINHCYSNSEDEDGYYPKLSLKTKTTRENIGASLDLVEEILLRTKLEDKKRIRELLMKTKSRIEMSMLQSGNLIAGSRVQSYFSAKMNYLDQVSGLSFYWNLREVLNNFDRDFEDLVEKLDKIYEKLFNINNLMISFTGSREDFEIFMEEKDRLLSKLKRESFQSQNYAFKEEALNEGIMSISNVQYVAKAYNFKKLGFKYSGHMNVLAMILNGDYLHNRVRAQGGAYGVGIGMSRTGNMTLTSYRDPNLTKTLESYDDMYSYIDQLELSERDLTDYIIGAMGSMNPVLTAQAQGAVALNRYITGITREDIKKTKEELVATTLEDLKNLVPVLEETMKEGYICVLGNEEVIEDHKEVFKNLVQLNK